MKLAEFNESREIVAFYECDSPDYEVPDGMRRVKLTDEQWQVLLTGQGEGKRMMINGSGEPALADRLPPTPEQLIEVNSRQRDLLLETASVALAPLQIAVSLGEATVEEVNAAKAWLAFSRSVKAVDLGQADPVWPVPPEIAGSN